jgi:hypothetical protein
VSSWLAGVTVAQKERIDLVAGQNDLIAMGARKSSEGEPGGGAWRWASAG